MNSTSVRSFITVTALSGVLLMSLAACSSGVDAPESCADEDGVLRVGFYAFFEPVSYSVDKDPDSDGFNIHAGYEADILSALEAMEGAGLSFSRHSIAAWDDIWLQSAVSQYDLVGGGITILDSRTRDSAGREAVRFTSGHITFRQSLLARAEDSNRLARYDDLTRDVRVGVLAGTTGEFRLLEITGIADAAGVLTAGTRVDTPQGTLVADGSADYVITAAGESPGLAVRHRIHPPSKDMPQVIYLGDETGEADLLEALAGGEIDVVARGEIGNRDATHAYGDQFVVAALDDKVEYGGFTLAAEDEDLARCLDEKIDWLTDGQRIGYSEWLQDPSVFLGRAKIWNDRDTG